MKIKFHINFFLPAFVFLCINIGNAQHLSHELLVEDARQMIEIVEACHPDPYLNTGGKTAFHFSFQEMLDNLPKEGMNVDEFWWELSAFLAKIKDGHTYLYDFGQINHQMPGGIPLQYSITSDSVIVVDKVYNENYKRYIGCRLLKVNDIDVDSLLLKVGEIYPVENIFDRFRKLKNYLWFGDYLVRIIDNWTIGDSLELEIMDKDSRVLAIKMETNSMIDYGNAYYGESSLDLVNNKKCDFVFSWLDEEYDIGYISIKKQDEFREYAEMTIDGLKAIQNKEVLSNYRKQFLMYAQKWHERYYGEKGPDSLELVVEKLPSFTEFMTDVTARLNDHQSKNLIIDLRDNRGGVSLMSDILVYFLYGKGKLSELHNDSYELTYLSPMAVETASSLNPEEINKGRINKQMLPLSIGDYDFSSYYEWKDRMDKQSVEELDPSLFIDSRTFYNEYTSGENESAYTPKNVYVIGNEKTFSAGFETLVRLKKCGAVIVGVPSAQSANCYGMAIEPVKGLKNSKIRLNVSVRKIFMYPDKDENAFQLNPDIPMDFQAFEQYAYDRNTPVHMILSKIDGN